MFISPVDWIGPSACSSSVASLPSHMKIAPHAALTTVGEWRPSLFIPWPTPTARPSPQPKLGLWQLAQDCADVTDKRVSKYSVLPSAAFSGVYALSFGNGMVGGRR